MKPVTLTGVSLDIGGVASSSTKTSRDFEKTLESLMESEERPAVSEPKRSDEHLRMSKHAQARLESRGVSIGEEEMARLEHAVDELSRRGAKESLVILGERAFIVGVPSRTVITVVDRASALGTVFTNIDSTYVAS